MPITASLKRKPFSLAIFTCAVCAVFSNIDQSVEMHRQGETGEEKELPEMFSRPLGPPRTN
jgi:hypothetical protein